MLKRVWCMLFTVLMLLALRPALGVTVKSKHTDEYFSTVSALFLYTEDSSAFDQAWQMVKQTLEQVQNAVSLSEPESDISRFNRLAYGESCSVSSITAQLFQIARVAYEATGGLYDPTVYPLVDLWGFSPRFNQNAYQPSQPYDRAYVNGKLPLPDSRYIQALQKLVGMENVLLLGDETSGWRLQKNTLPVTVNGDTFQAQLDLGGIAKGFACDMVIDHLTQMGFTQGHFICGGSSISLLSKPEGNYSLTLAKPRTGRSSESYFATVFAQNTMVSTSSDANHTYTVDGIIYCHIIDPRTGHPINTPVKNEPQRGIASVTLLGPSAAYNDALSTALCVMAPMAAMEYVNGTLKDQYAVIVFFETGSPNLEVFTNLPDSAFVLEDDAYLRVSAIGERGKAIYTGSLFSAKENGGVP
ncbi:MAG: FAD:protein FMN transferase [Christensenellales bacterium]